MSRHGCLERKPQTKADRRPRSTAGSNNESEHVQWCQNRYQSYRAHDNTFQPYNGPRRVCYSRGHGGGSYRTVCVRKCDGYFFPLAFQRNRGGFDRDQNICQGIYGKEQAELYFFPSDGTIDNARSIGGDAYKDKSFAFLYQREFRQDCQGQLNSGLSKVRSSFLAATDKVRFKRYAVIPIPVPRPSSSDEPDAWKPRASPAAQAVSHVIEGIAPYQDESSSLAFSGADPTEDPRKIGTEAGIRPVAYGEPRTVGDSNPFVEANSGAPARIPGYIPPQIKDFRAPLRASALAQPP